MVLQCSCLGSLMDRGAWWVTVHGVTESDTTSKLHHHYCHPVPALLWDSILLRKTAHSQGGRVPRTRLWSPLCPLLGAVCLSLQSFSLQEASVLSSPLPLSSAADTRVSSFRESRMSPAVSSSGFTLPPSPKCTVLVFTPLLPV